MKQLRILGILMVVLFMASCLKTEDQTTGTGDAIIVSKKSGPDVVYGLSIYAYTNGAFSSVKVVPAADPGKLYTLKANQGFKNNFYYETPESEFSTTKPAASVYNFSVIFDNGTIQEFHNTLTADVLPIPTFDKCEYNVVGHQLEINWPLLNGAGSYAINIIDGTKIVFSSIEIKNPVKGAYAVLTTGGGWAAGFTPESGKTYRVRLFAYLFEPGGGAANLQNVAIADSTAVWGN
jgi:hypothetical protein